MSAVRLKLSALLAAWLATAAAGGHDGRYAAAVAAQPEALARTHYENFPVGSLLLPRRARQPLHRIYAFARTADDLADEQRDAAALAAFRAAFTAHLAGRAVEPNALLQDLVASIRELRLPTEPFFDLLDAFDSDLSVPRHSRASLLAYCRKSANPIGRLVLRVHGYTDAALDELSDRVCSALQIVNHLQDVRSDLVERDRIYLPSEDLAQHGVAELELRASEASAGLRAVIQTWATHARSELRQGWALTTLVRGRLRLELRAILHGAAAVLQCLEAASYDPLAGRVRLTKSQRVRSLLRAMLPHLPRALGRDGASAATLPHGQA